MYDINIDFDYASECWKKNKIKLSNGCYKYKKIQCSAITRNGNQCKKTSEHKFCYIHNK